MPVVSVSPYACSTGMPSIRKNCCVSGARRGTAEERAKARAKTSANLSEDECTAEAEPKCIVYTAAPNVQALPGGARFCKQGSDDRGALGDGVLDATPDAFEQRGDVQKIMRRRQTDFVGELIEIRGEGKDTFA